MPGLINLDFADVRAIMKDAGSALMGIGRASGENRAVEAARQAIASPLLEVDIAGAQGILFNITGSSSLSLYEVTEAAEEIRAAADPEANIIFGTSFNERLGDEVMITVIATGFDGGKKRQIARADATAGVMDSSRGRPAVARARLPRGAPAPARRGRRRPRRTRRPTPLDDEAAAAVAVAARSSARSARPQPAKRPATDLRRGRPGDPELPPPEVSRAGRVAGDPSMTESETRIDGYRAARERVLARIAAACARAGREPGDVTLVAVSKTVAADALRDAVAAGLDAARREPGPGGRGQGAGGARARAGISSVRSSRTRPAGRSRSSRRSSRSTRSSSARRLDRLAGEVRPGRPLPGPAPGQRRRRSGQGRLRAGRARRGAGRARSSCRDLEVRGPDDGRPAVDRPGRRAAHVPRACASCRSGCAARWPALGPELSMGMTDDFEVAVEEGATIVRVGRALFGERPHDHGTAGHGRHRDQPADSPGPARRRRAGW